MNNKHTEGPWELDQEEGTVSKFRIYETNDGANVGWFDPDAEQWEQGDANAALIAAAPDMLGALRDSLATLTRWQEFAPEDWDERDRLTYENINAAIAKADGTKQ